jgi:hypothetical protein
MNTREYLGAIPQFSAEQADRSIEMATKIRPFVDEAILQQVTSLRESEVADVIVTLMSGAVVVALDGVAERFSDDGRPLLFKGISEHADDALAYLAKEQPRLAEIHLDAIRKIALIGQT